jgi:sortase A
MDLTNGHHTGLPPLALTPAPSHVDPAADSPIGLLSIPKIGLLDAIVEGVGESQLAQGPGHYPGTPLPGEAGNAAIAGHRTTYAHPFYNLNELAPGDPIYILTSQGFFRYVVSETEVVAPTDVAVLDPVAHKSTLTLTTCNPRYSASTRMVVVADFDGKSQGSVPTTPPDSVARGAQLQNLPGDSLSGSGNSWWPAVLWGALTIAIGMAAVLLWRVSPRLLRWGIVLVSAVAIVASLLVCFEQISLALPPGF